jgi:hypothetical protein
MKKLYFLALLSLISVTQGAFAASAPNNYPNCYKGYGSTSSNYNGTNGDSATFKGWCIDGFGNWVPASIATSTSQPNNQGGMAYPVTSYNVGPNNGNGALSPATFDAITPQQTGITIVDYGGWTPVASVDSLVGSGGHYVLPPAYPGEQITIVSASKSVITVDTLNTAFATTEGLTYPTADTIEWSPAGTAMTAGQNLKSNGNAGATITLVSPLAGVWVIKDMLDQIGGTATSDALWNVISTQ